MTHFEYDLATRVVLGLFGCAYILVALIADWRERRGWVSYTLDFGDVQQTTSARKADQFTTRSDQWRI